VQKGFLVKNKVLSGHCLRPFLSKKCNKNLISSEAKNTPTAIKLNIFVFYSGYEKALFKLWFPG
jgi:hypothetical protein